MAEFYKGRGKKEDEKKLIEMLDDVFFCDDEKTDFLSLLPKLYKSQYNPAYNNFCIMQDGKFKGAVGLYPATAKVAGKSLKIGGIGNVAVDRSARRLGYMKECMNMCIEQMKSDGTDYSLLGGQRQRYGYFGYEPAGSGLFFNLDKTNIRHICGEDYKSPLTYKKVEPSDTGLLEQINRLYRSSAAYVERSPEALFDILCSWSSVPYAVFKGDEFKGYFSLGNEGWVSEFKPVNAEDTVDMALCIMEIAGSDEAKLSIPQSDSAICEKLAQISECCEAQHCEMLNIFNFAAFTEAFLKAKALRTGLCDGELVLHIHGIKQDEKILISVKNNSVSVEPTEKEADAELEHNEAVRAIASVYSGARLKFPPFAQTWFPVDFYSYSLDNV